MADRVSVTIKIGGDLPQPLFPNFADLIQSYALRTFEDEDFDAAMVTGLGPLELAATEVAWGRLDDLEEFCVKNSLHFARWCDACPGTWEAERLVFDGHGEPRSYSATTNDSLVITSPEARDLGSIAAINAWFASGEPTIPPLRLLREEADHG